MEEQFKGGKVWIFKKKKRKNYRRFRGFRPVRHLLLLETHVRLCWHASYNNRNVLLMMIKPEFDGFKNIQRRENRTRRRSGGGGVGRGQGDLELELELELEPVANNVHI